MNFKQLFGRKKKSGAPAETTQDAMQKLCNAENLLIRKQEHLEKKAEAEREIAKKNATTNKRVALQALRRKKQFENQLQQLDGTLNTIQHQKFSLENASTNVEVLQVLSTTSKSMKQACGNMDADQIHDLLDEIAEQRHMADEVSQAISNPIGERFDEDDLLAELEDLENEMLDKKFLVSTREGMSNVNIEPRAQISKSKPIDEDKEFAKLASWAN